MIFVFDLDGTICFHGQPLQQEICDALDECLRCGHEVIFASARPIRDMLPVIPTKYHTCPMVGGNGSFTYVNKAINVIYFSEDVISILKKLVQSYKLPYLADSDWHYAYTGDTTHPIYQNLDPQKTASNLPLQDLNRISKLVLFAPPDEVKRKLQQLPVTLFEHQNENLLDISPLHINKWAGLQTLQISQFIVFGNDINDLPLFEQALHSVCVGNHPVAKHANEQIQISDVAEKIKNLANSI